MYILQLLYIYSILQYLFCTCVEHKWTNTYTRTHTHMTRHVIIIIITITITILLLLLYIYVCEQIIYTYIHIYICEHIWTNGWPYTIWFPYDAWIHLYGLCIRVHHGHRNGFDRMTWKPGSWSWAWTTRGRPPSSRPWPQKISPIPCLHRASTSRASCRMASSWNSFEVDVSTWCADVNIRKPCKKMWENPWVSLSENDLEMVGLPHLSQDGCMAHSAAMFQGV